MPKHRFTLCKSLLTVVLYMESGQCCVEKSERNLDAKNLKSIPIYDIPQNTKAVMKSKLHHKSSV